MSNYPDSLFVPRTVENRAGVSYDASKTKVFYAEDINDATAEIVAIQETLGLNPEGSATTVGDRLDTIEADLVAVEDVGGWKVLAVTPTRQSADDPTFVLRFAADMTAILWPGMRLKLTQNSAVKYFIVTAVGSYTGGNTDVTVYGGTDYDVNDTSTYPITYPYYSHEKAPVGFPLDASKWKIEVVDTGITSQNNPVYDTWYNINSTNIVLPIGQWHVSVKAQFMTNAANPVYAFATLSTSNNSETDVDFTRQQEVNGSSLRICLLVSVEKTLLLASKTTYYLNAKVTVSGITNLWLRGDNEKMIIRATCAYL